MKLDGVASEGSDQVKQKRKEVVHQVEAELGRVETWKAAQWKVQQKRVDLEIAQSVPLPDMETDEE